jgi:2-polyprenyl-6-methoxyphenol hydroxylase-like FAD-dependent oxidoreductase
VYQEVRKRPIFTGFLQWGMTQRFDVCIRGDGIVGRSLALLLARERLKVAIQRGGGAATPQDVRAYALNQASRQLLERLRVWPQASEVTPVTGMQVWGDDGGFMAFEPPAGTGELAWLVAATALEDTLAQALRFAPEVSMLEPGPAPQAALTVVCEGRDSSSRRELGIQWQAKPYAQKALAARLHSTLPHGGVARQWFQDAGILALLPMGGQNGHELALVWSVPLARADQLLALPGDEFTQALQAAAGAQVGQLELSSPVMAWPLQLARADRWVAPGWALAGDAAHTLHPLAGQGLNLGLADAAELARVVGEREYWRSPGDLRLLRRYERARKAEVLAMGLVTDGLQGLFSHTDARWQALRNWGMRAVGGQSFIKSWLTRRAMG